MAAITVDWPTAGLTLEQWRTRVEALAEQAEAMIGRTDVPLQAQGRLAIEFCGLMWPALSAEVIAGSARASLLLGAPGVILSSAPADQCQEIASRLDAIWQQAQADPSAAVVEVHPPLVELPPPPPAAPAKIGRPPKVREPEELQQVVALEPAPADLSTLSDAAFLALGEVGLPVGEPEPVPSPEPQPPALTTPPPGWLTTPEAAELLGVSIATISNWRHRGRFGAQGVGHIQIGRTCWHSPEAVEAIEAGEIPAGLDQLLSDVQDAA